MEKISTILWVSVLLLQMSSASIVSARESLNKTFAQWCQQRDSLPENTKYTINVMLERAGTKDCQEAERYFNKLSRHQSGADQISDLRPIASLKNLTNLDLGGNQKISDLRPLASLNKLTHLNLVNNQISEIGSLAGLNKLTQLYLDDKFAEKCPLKLKTCTVKRIPR